MKNNRRNFIKLAGLSGLGIGSGFLKAFAKEPQNYDPETQHLMGFPDNKRFNMSGYAAPRIDTVRVGVIGLHRGRAHVQSLSKIEGVGIKVICDLLPERINLIKEDLKGSGQNPTVYTGDEEAWKKMCEREDIDLVYIATPWDLHTPMALYAMNHGKHVGVEIPAATTIEECWQLVNTSERTRKHCMILENCCYDFFELLILNMTRQGVLGEIINAEGGYIHHLLEGLVMKNNKWHMWRLKENLRRRGDLYPSHGLGPAAQVLNINRGDKMDYMVSMSSNDFAFEERIKELGKEDDFYKPYLNKKYNGNVCTSLIRTGKGKTIMLQHDVSSPNVYSRIFKVVGTKGSALKYPLPGRISLANDKDGWLSDEKMKSIEKDYQPEIVKRIGQMAKKVGGHGGMDFLMSWRLIDCLRNGLPLDIDVYDAASWSCIFPLSEQSLSKGSSPVKVPDFTGGYWKTNKPVDINISKGGNTKVKI